MCGIVGGIVQGDPAAFAQRVESGLRRLAHRGPDDRGAVAEWCAGVHVLLGHTRLAIIDVTPGGAQPMSSADGRFTMVFNGEIYNYVEIRRRLEHHGVRFRSVSDTEVLLEAWARWGQTCLRELVGMFAFAVLDRTQRTLTLMRDAFGVKPLYYVERGSETCFASEIPALLEAAGISRRLNDAVAVDYLIGHQLDMGPDTFVDGVKALLPAHMMTIDLASGTSKTERWWTPSIAQDRPRTHRQAVEELRTLFLDSIRMHMRSDVPVGIALSGGIDSSAIACCVRHCYPDADLRTFSYIADGGAISEEPWIDAVNAAIGAEAHKIRIGPEDLEHDLDALIRAQGEPFGGTMPYAQHRVFRAARDAGVKVVLEGQGGDEMLGGYAGYPGFVVRSHLERVDPAGAVRFARSWTRANRDRGPMRYRDLVSELPFPGRSTRARRRRLERVKQRPWMRPGVAAASRTIAYGRPFVGSAFGRRLMEQLVRSMTRDSLPHLLRYGDRNAMAFSVENRVPFVTTQLAEFMLSLPESFLIDESGRTKSIFRDAMRGIVPDVILDRTDKIAFSTPMKTWMRRPIRQRLQALVDMRERTVVCPRAACDFVAGELDDPVRTDIDWTAWRVFNLLSWQREFGVMSNRA